MNCQVGLRAELTFQAEKMIPSAPSLTCCADLEKSQGKLSPVVKDMLFPAF